MYGALTMGSCYMIVAFTLLGARQNPDMQVRVSDYVPSGPKL